MPRIANVGEFDWDFPEPQTDDFYFGSDLLLHFRLRLMDRLVGRGRNWVRECVAYDDDGKNLMSSHSGSFPSIGVVSEEETRFLTSRLRETGRHLASLHWKPRGIAIACLVSFDRKRSNEVKYSLAVKAKSPGTFVEMPTNFIESVVRKIGKQAERVGFDCLMRPIRNRDIFNDGIVAYQFELRTDAENVERMFLRVQKVCMEEIDWRSAYRGDRFVIQIKTFGDTSKVVAACKDVFPANEL